MPDEKDDLIPVTVTLPWELLKQVDERCAKEDLNRSQWVRRALRRDCGPSAPIRERKSKEVAA